MQVLNLNNINFKKLILKNMLKKNINYILEHTFFSLNISLVKSSIVSNVCRFLYVCVGLALTFFSSMDNIISRPDKPMKPQNFPSRMQHASTKVNFCDSLFCIWCYDHEFFEITVFSFSFSFLSQLSVVKRKLIL